jgi:hypothetical protein
MKAESGSGSRSERRTWKGGAWALATVLFLGMAAAERAAAEPGSQPASQPTSQPSSQPSGESGDEMSPEAARGRELIERMMAAVGSMDDLKALKDIEYRYSYRDAQTGKEDVSIERYVFDGEYSWAKYLLREKLMLPNLPGEMIQSYDGESTWVTLDGEPNTGGMILKMAHFSRKTNFYWLTMFQKLLDPGTQQTYAGTRMVDGVEYELVRITYGEGVGDVQDTYLLYVHPETYLVDQFLFTVMDFNMQEPHLMKVEYEEFDGVKLPTKRTYAPSNWEGEVAPDADWTDEISENLKFDNGFAREMFQSPDAEWPESEADCGCG